MDSPKSDLNAVLDTMFSTLNDVREMVLSTCAENRVTSRVVSCACNREEVIFLSWEHHTKCKQISVNPCVALCHKNLQLEGRAKIMGSPLDIANKAYADRFREKQPVIFRQFSQLPGMVIVKVSLAAITSWTRDEQGHCIYHFDLEKREFRRIRPAEAYDW